MSRRMRGVGPALGRACAGELVGTYLLAFFGCGAVLSAVITGAQVRLRQVAVVWGFGISLAIYAIAAASGAHLNPVVTLSVALRRRETFPPARNLPTVAGAALLGGPARRRFLAAATLYACFSPFIRRFETLHHLVRGRPGSQLSAMIFGEYGPNPADFGTALATVALLSPLAIMLIEALGTAILLFFIFALVDRHNRDAPGGNLAPFFIGFSVAIIISGFSVAIIISVLAPLAQAGLNPARDLGPRLFALLAGWGAVALPSPNGVWWAYIVGPLLGGPVGATLYDLLIRTTPPQEERRRRRGDCGTMTTMTNQRILFLCTHNSARSQMAEGLLRHLGGDRFEAFSAGTAATQVRPLAITVMAELGIDISKQESKTLDRYLGERFDAVITVCDQANESCPIFPGAKTRLHWSFPDPSGAMGTEEEQLTVYRAVRDAIRQRIEAELLAPRRRSADAGHAGANGDAAPCSTHRAGRPAR